MKKYIIVSLFLSVLFIISFRYICNPYGKILKITICKEIDLSTEPPQPKNETDEFSLGDKTIILFILLANNSGKDCLNIALIDPLGKSYANITFPIGKTWTEKYNWTACWIEFPIRGNIYASINIRTSNKETIKWNYILNNTISSTGHWMFIITFNNREYKVGFTLRQVILSLTILNDLDEPLSDVLIKISSGPFFTSVFSKTGNIHIQVSPGVYNVTVEYANKTIAFATLNVIRDTYCRIVAKAYRLNIKVLSNKDIPLHGATVCLYRDNIKFFSGFTNKNGYTSTILLPYGKYAIKVMWMNRTVGIIEMNISKSQNITIKTKVYEVYAYIIGEQSQPLVHAKIRCDEMNITKYTSSNGLVFIGLLPQGKYTFYIYYKNIDKKISAEIYEDKTIIINLPVFIEFLNYTFSKQLFIIFLIEINIIIFGLIIFTYMMKKIKDQLL